VIERVRREQGSGWLAPRDVATILVAAGIEHQPMRNGGDLAGAIKARVAVTGDPTFGPLVLCGLGGVLSELAEDVSYRLPPVSDMDASEMIESLRFRPLLEGYGGGPAGDREALAAILQRTSALVDALPELEELELNPIALLAPGRGAIVMGARIRVAWPAGRCDGSTTGQGGGTCTNS
jgi:hypothetical protein